MNRNILTTVVAAALVAASALVAPTRAAAQKNDGALTMPVTGAGEGVTFVGTFTLQKFVPTDSGVDAVGTITGSATDAVGATVTVVRNVVLPVDIGQATCEILHLELGPISLDLLGLQVDLNQVILDITAQAGAGNLLGNLLCAVVGLLDDPGGLANLLNQILDLIS